ncbi:MAG: LptF/LptG family permease [SAR324 cluster bacterium]|nr:LptF/LptG family permease [SAR324 cluster bacterium]
MVFFRYIFSQLILPYFLSVAILTFVLSMDTVYRLINLIVAKGVDASSVGLLLVYRLPQFLSVTLPLAVPVAVLIVMVRLSMDLELTAMHAAGVGVRTIASPVVIFGLLLTGLTLFITLWVQPTGFAAFEAEQLRILESHTTQRIQPKILNYDFDGKVLYVQEKEEGDRLSGVFISDRRLKKKSMVVAADRGIVQVKEKEQELILKLFNGMIHLTEEKPEIYRTIAFQSFDYIFKIPEIVSSGGGHIWGVSTLELLNRKTHGAHVELLLRLTTPWACLGFALATITIGVTDPRSGRIGSYLRALILIIVYYILWMGAKDLTFKEGMTPHVLWIPPFAIICIGFYNLYKYHHNLENVFFIFRHLFLKRQNQKII